MRGLAGASDRHVAKDDRGQGALPLFQEAPVVSSMAQVHPRLEQRGQGSPPPAVPEDARGGPVTSG